MPVFTKTAAGREGRKQTGSVLSIPGSAKLRFHSSHAKIEAVPQGVPVYQIIPFLPATEFQGTRPRICSAPLAESSKAALLQIFRSSNEVKFQLFISPSWLFLHQKCSAKFNLARHPLSSSPEAIPQLSR